MWSSTITMVTTQVVCISTSTHRYSTDYHTAQTAKTSMSQYLQRPATQRIWTITHNAKGLSEVIHCNEVEVLNVLIFLFNTYFTSVVPTALLLQCNWPITGIRRVL